MQVVAPFVLKRKRIFIRVICLVAAVILTTMLLSQTVFAKNTYVITDGKQVRIYSTYATNPAEVLTQAGVELEEGDTFETQPGDGVSEITVRRSQLISINNRGEALETVSYGETLGELLDRLGVAVPADCSISMALSTPTYDGMEVFIDRILEVTETYTVDIPYETVYCYDSALPEGEQEVLVAGVTGQLLRQANVVYVDAVETSRTVVKETVLQQPVNEMISVGTGAKAEPAGLVIGNGFIVTETGEVLTYTRSDQFMTTAYTKTDAGCDDITATGTYARVGEVAVDPKVVPYGTRMFIVSNDGEYIYGIATAEDCGGGVKGKHIDLYMDTTEECFQFGRRSCTVYFLG